MTKSKRVGRPPRNTSGQRRTLVLTCTDEEWQRLLQVLPQDTRDRFELIDQLVSMAGKVEVK